MRRCLPGVRKPWPTVFDFAISVVLPMDFAVALVADGNQVPVCQTPPWRVAKMVRFDRRSLAASFHRPRRANTGAHLKEPWMRQVFGIAAVRRITRRGGL